MLPNSSHRAAEEFREEIRGMARTASSPRARPLGALPLVPTFRLTLIAFAAVTLLVPLSDRARAGEPNANPVSQSQEESSSSSDDTGTRNSEGDEKLPEDEPVVAESTDGHQSYRNEVIRGRVGWLGASLKDQFGISTVPEAADRVLAMVTDDGEVVPLVEDVRGRAFRKDDRLRDKPLELWVRRYQGQPFAQILKVVEIDDGKRYEVDYWCDICAIPMYETGPCSCCQDHNRIRKRLLEESGPEAGELVERIGGEQGVDRE